MLTLVQEQSLFLLKLTNIRVEAKDEARNFGVVKAKQKTKGLLMLFFFSAVLIVGVPFPFGV